MTPWTAGILYAAAVFGCGFVLGTARVLVVAPAWGALPATLAELPVILALSWCLARGIAGRLRRPDSRQDRALMGLWGLALLLGAETLLGSLLFGRSAGAVLAGWTTPEGAAGLAGQVLFGLFPILVRRAGADAR